MEKKEKQNKKEILVIVAHPDDETIWAGGMLLKSNDNKTIISLCRKQDKDREPKFQKVCKMLGAKGYIFDLDDSEEGDYKKISSEEIINPILEITKGKKYDLLYTHGKNGEYGHIRHLEVHDTVDGMLNEGKLHAKTVLFFSYARERDVEGEPCHINSSADKLIRLEKPYFKMKKKLIKDIYGFQEGGFEVESSRDVEAFDVRR